MIISKQALEKIKKIIDNNYHALLMTVGGDKSLLSMIYYNNVLNDLDSTTGPISIEDMTEQQRNVPQGEAHAVAEEHINENFIQLIQKLKANSQANLEGIIRDHNLSYRNNALQNLERTDALDKLVKQSTVGGLKQKLRDLSGDANHDWQRVAVTETANAMGLGSVDRIVMQNKEKDLDEVYVYRIPVNDAALCKYCRRFYLDGDDSPAVYRMSTLLNNGSNYGRKASEWKAVAGATHPNDRESGVLELRAGWKVVAGGKLEFIGLDEWRTYIQAKLRD